MRIISGKFKSRKFIPPADKWPTRPTTDFAKEGLFNILVNQIDFEDLKVLDLFGGSGNIGFECLSRGCKKVTYVDNFRQCATFAQKVALELGVSDDMDILKMDVFKFLSSYHETYDLIFADPPYDHIKLREIPDLVFDSELLNTSGMLVVEHDKKNNFSNHTRFNMDRKYGTTIFSFFK